MCKVCNDTLRVHMLDIWEYGTWQALHGDSQLQSPPRLTVPCPQCRGDQCGQFIAQRWITHGYPLPGTGPQSQFQLTPMEDRLDGATVFVIKVKE